MRDGGARERETSFEHSTTESRSDLKSGREKKRQPERAKYRKWRGTGRCKKGDKRGQKNAAMVWRREKRDHLLSNRSAIKDNRTKTHACDVLPINSESQDWNQLP